MSNFNQSSFDFQLTLGCVRELLRYLKEIHLTRIIGCVNLNVIIHNSGYCNQVSFIDYTVIRYLALSFKFFVVYRCYFCTLMLLQKVLHHQEDS